MEGRILIAGAGIGGLTTALCLAKSGHQVTILERRERLEEAGAGIQVSPNASRVLATLGLRPALEQIAVPARNLIVRRFSAASQIVSMSLDDLARRHQSPYWLLRRADLQKVLLDAVEAAPEIVIGYGRTVDAIDEMPDGLVVRDMAGDGTGTRHRAEMLIGADGIWSSIAGIIGSKEIKPDFTGYEAWRALLPIDEVPLPLRGPDVSLWLGSEAHVVAYPVSGGAFQNIVLVRRNTASEAGWTRIGYPSALTPLLGGAAPDLRRLLECVTGWQIWSLFDTPARTMASGRIALVGDAAHPILPFLAQGAALAIEDGATLAALLSPATLADNAALRRNLLRYDRERRPRAANVQRAARSNGRTYHLGWPASVLRDRAMSLLGGDGLMRRYDWLYGWSHQHF